MIATLGPVADEVLIYNIPGLPPEDSAARAGLRRPDRRAGAAARSAASPMTGGDKRAGGSPARGEFRGAGLADDLRRGAGPLGPGVRLQRRGDRQRDLPRHQPAGRIPRTRPRCAGWSSWSSRSASPWPSPARSGPTASCTSSRCWANASRRSRSSAPASPGRRCITSRRSPGRCAPEIAPLFMARTYLARTYPRVIEIMQTVGAGGLLAMPSMADLQSADRPRDRTLLPGRRGHAGRRAGGALQARLGPLR